MPDSIPPEPSAATNTAPRVPFLGRALKIYGIVLMVGGVISIALPYFAGVAVEAIIGMFFVLIGLLTLSTGVMIPLAQRWLLVVIGAAEIILGSMILTHPYAGLMAIAAYIGVAFLFQGISRMFLIHHLGGIKKHIPWFIGAVSAVFVGILILSSLQTSASWVLGTVCGVSLLFHGFSATYASSKARTMNI